MFHAATVSISLCLVLTGMVAGCHPSPAPPPPQVPVPQQGERQQARAEMRPLPPPSYSDPAAQPPFDDPPLVTQRPPEQRAFIEAYQRAGAPRIALLVAGAEDASVAAIDYDAVETIMSDWLAANGQVTLIAPTVARRKLSDAQVRNSIATELGADVIVYVKAAATPSSNDGKDLRLVAQAIGVRGGQSIGRAVVDVPPPLDKPTINDYTRFLARKLMDDMIATWNAAPAGPAAPAAIPVPPPAN